VVIDSHAHIFQEVAGLVAAGPTKGIGYGRVVAGGQVIQVIPPLCEKTTHTPEMLLAHMRWAGVDRAILLQGPFYGECNRYALDAVQAHPQDLSGVAYFDPWAPEPRRVFQAICDAEAFVGIKLEFSEATGLCGIHGGVKLQGQDTAWLWDELERVDMTLVIDLGAVGSSSYQTNALRHIAVEHPRLKIVIAHLAQPNPVVEADRALWQLWEEQIDLGRLPNVYFDTASLPAYVTSDGYPFPLAGRYLRIAINRIGPGKIMWGTDIPALLSYATYPQLLQAARIHLDFLSGDERDMVMGGNASRVYRANSGCS